MGIKDLPHVIVSFRGVVDLQLSHWLAVVVNAKE